MARFILARVPEKSDVWVLDKDGNQMPYSVVEWLMDEREIAMGEIGPRYFDPAWAALKQSRAIPAIIAKDNEEVEGEWRVPDA